MGSSRRCDTCHDMIVLLIPKHPGKCENSIHVHYNFLVIYIQNDKTNVISPQPANQSEISFFLLFCLNVKTSLRSFFHVIVKYINLF